MHAAKRQRHGGKRGDVAGCDEIAPAHTHLDAVFVVRRDEPGAEGERQQVEHDVVHNRVYNRLRAEDGGQHGVTDEARVTEDEHEAVHAATTVGDAQHVGDQVGDGDEQRIAEHGKPDDLGHKHGIGQAVHVKHRCQDKRRQRGVQDKPREPLVEIGVHNARFLTDIADAYSGEQGHHLREDAAELAKHRFPSLSLRIA